MPEEWLPLTCPFCHAKFRIKRIYAHLKGRCPACNFRINAPISRPAELPSISEADEPLGLAPLHDDEWPEPPRLEEADDDPDYGFTAAPIPLAKDGPHPDTPKPQTEEALSAGTYGFKAPIAETPAPVDKSVPATPRGKEPASEPIVTPYKPKDIFTEARAVGSGTPLTTAPFAKTPPKLDEWGFPVEESAAPVKPTEVPVAKPPLPVAAPTVKNVPPPVAARPKPASSKKDQDDYNLKSDAKAHDPVEADKAAADAIMRQAHIDLDKKEEDERGPIESPMWNGVYGFPFTAHTVRTWLLLTLGLTVLSLQTAVIKFFIDEGLNFGSIVAIGAIVMGMFWIAVLTGSYGASRFLAIVQDTANGAEKPAWPDSSWKEGFFQFLMLMWLFGVWIGVPSGIMLMLKVPYIIPAILVGALIFFPTSLLSSLASGSAWALMNGTILGRIWKRKSVFFSLMLSSFFLWGLPGYLLYLTGRYASFAAAFFAGPLWAAGILIYARLLGRVGWILTEQDRVARKKKQRKKLLPKKRRDGQDAEPAAEPAGGEGTDWDG